MRMIILKQSVDTVCLKKVTAAKFLQGGLSLFPPHTYNYTYNDHNPCIEICICTYTLIVMYILYMIHMHFFLRFFPVRREN